MPATCCVYGCTNRSNKQNSMITFHQFPKDERKRNEWIEAIGRSNWFPNKHTKICSEHFEEHMLDRSMNRVTVKRNAVPTIFKAYQLVLPAKRRNSKKTSSASSKRSNMDCDVGSSDDVSDKRENRISRAYVIECSSPIHELDESITLNDIDENDDDDYKRECFSPTDSCYSEDDAQDNASLVDTTMDAGTEAVEQVPFHSNSVTNEKSSHQNIESADFGKSGIEANTPSYLLNYVPTYAYNVVPDVGTAPDPGNAAAALNSIPLLLVSSPVPVNGLQIQPSIPTSNLSTQNFVTVSSPPIEDCETLRTQLNNYQLRKKQLDEDLKKIEMKNCQYERTIDLLRDENNRFNKKFNALTDLVYKLKMKSIRQKLVED